MMALICKIILHHEQRAYQHLNGEQTKRRKMKKRKKISEMLFNCESQGIVSCGMGFLADDDELNVWRCMLF